MARWTQLAGRPIEQHSSPNVGGPMTAHRGIVLHHAEGGYRGTISWQMNPDQRYSSGESVTTSSTWVVGKEPGEWAQLVDTDTVAWCQRSGSYQWNSIELAGYHTEALTAWQIEACAQLLAEYHRRYGITLQVTSDTGSFGLGHHSMDDDLRVEWGHDDCPGAQTIAAKAQIVARAIAIVNGEEPDMDAAEVALLFNGTSATTHALGMHDEAPQRFLSGPNVNKTGPDLPMPLVAAVRDIKAGVAKLVNEGLPVQITVDEATEDRIAAKVAVKLEPTIEAVVRKIFADAGTQ